MSTCKKQISHWYCRQCHMIGQQTSFELLISINKYYATQFLRVILFRIEPGRYNYLVSPHTGIFVY